MAEPTLDEREAAAMEQLRGDLDRHFQHNRAAAHAIGQALFFGTQQPHREAALSKRVGISLLVRAANDARAVALLAVRGYPLQSATITASILEEAFTIGFIGDSDELAAEWVRHERPRAPFRRVDVLVGDTIRRESTAMGKAEAERTVEREMRVYAELCMAKHANPHLQKGYGIRVKPEGIEVAAGPDPNENALRLSWFAMQHSARLSVSAVIQFSRWHLRGIDTSELRHEVEGVSRERRALAELARGKGWGVDPFPEGWFQGRRAP